MIISERLAPALHWSLLSSEYLPQVFLRFVQQAPLLGVQCLACPIDIKRQHRHGGLIGTALSPGAGFSGVLQREGDLPRASLCKHTLFEIQRIAAPGDIS